jgi:hypothetical protein
MLEVDDVASEPRFQPIARFLADYLAAARIDPPWLARAIPVPALPVDIAVPSFDPAGWQARVISHDVSLARVDMVVETDRPAYIQLAHPFFPAIAVTVNGAAVRAVPTSIGLIVLALPAGRSEIALRHVVTPVRALSLDISIAAFAVSLGVTLGLLLWRPLRAKAARAETEKIARS